MACNGRGDENKSPPVQGDTVVRGQQELCCDKVQVPDVSMNRLGDSPFLPVPGSTLSLVDRKTKLWEGRRWSTPSPPSSKASSGGKSQRGHLNDGLGVGELITHRERAPDIFGAVIHIQESPPHKRFIVGCRSPFMRLAEHLTALRACCKQCLPGR